MAQDDDLDEPYRRAMKHAPEFIGLSEAQAAELAQKVGLSVDMVPYDGWHAGVEISGRVTLFVEQGIVRRADPG
jgi:hypothetical protein